MTKLADFAGINQPNETVVVEKTQHSNFLSVKLADSVHAFFAPLALIAPAVLPFVQASALTLVVYEGSGVGIAVGPFIDTFAFLLPIEKLAFVVFAIVQEQLARTMLNIMAPLSFVNVAVLVDIATLRAFVVDKVAIKYISIEEN